MPIPGGTAGTLVRQEDMQNLDEPTIAMRRFDEGDADDTRADEARIESALNEEFERSAYPPLRNLRASLDGEAVRLQGTVRTYYQKQIAQQAAMDLLKLYAATQRLVNEVKVVR